MEIKVKIKRIENGKIPEYKTEGSSGADCYARIDKPVVIKARKFATIPLGFAVEIPEGYEMQIRPRSGLARKNGIETVLGTIDSDYRGEVGAIVFNDSDFDFVVKNEDRIAQAVIAPVIKANWIETEELSETKRGEGGFGSTGIRAGENKIEKFYEPFKASDFEKVKALIGKEVLIDNSIVGKINNVFPTKEIVKSYYIEIKLDEGQTFCGLDFANFSFINAFERVTMDGHRFGKELEFE